MADACLCYSFASRPRESIKNVDFAFANLDGCDLRGCNFRQVNFKGACLKGADLRHSSFDAGIFTDADLTGTKMVHLLRETVTLTMRKLLSPTGKPAMDPNRKAAKFRNSSHFPRFELSLYRVPIVLSPMVKFRVRQITRADPTAILHHSR